MSVFLSTILLSSAVALLQGNPELPPVIFTPPVASAEEKMREVPFYSQFSDISDPAWQKVGCGIASLAMIVDYYGPAMPADTLLAEGIAGDAYLDNAGWTYAGLIDISELHGLTGKSVVMTNMNMTKAYSALQKSVEQGPVMASVYYTFTPGHPIPHLVVVNSIKDGVVYYNDPAEPTGNGTISAEKFKSAWKKRYIEFHPRTDA